MTLPSLKLGPIQLSNPLIMAPMTTYSSNLDFTFSKEELNYYEMRARGLGCIITAATAVSNQAQAFPLQVSLKDDSYIDSHRDLVQRVHAQGAKIMVQLHHGGRMNFPELHTDVSNIVSASAIAANRPNLVTPRALSEAEVEGIIDDFVAALKRAIKAGYDGAELHGANTYLLQQFFSPHSNRRSDKFGGSLDKRMTFAKVLIERCHHEIYKADVPFALGYRFSPEEIEDPGITLDDTQALISLLKTLPLDFLHVSLGHYAQTSSRNQSDTRLIVDVIQEALEHHIPLIGVGQIKTLSDISSALSLGYDAVAVGMAIIADPHWATHVLQGTDPRRVVDGESFLPTPLFQRLSNNKPWFERNGYQFTE